MAAAKVRSNEFEWTWLIQYPKMERCLLKCLNITEDNSVKRTTDENIAEMTERSYNIKLINHCTVRTG